VNLVTDFSRLRTVIHLISCRHRRSHSHVNAVRQQYFSATSLSELFQNTTYQRIIKVLSIKYYLIKTYYYYYYYFILLMPLDFINIFKKTCF